MIRKTIAIATLTSAVFFSCGDKKTEQNTSKNQETETITNADGQTLKMAFNTKSNSAEVVFNNETVTLTSQKPASGIWYTNDHYELRGKGQNVTLTKDGQVVFTHKGTAPIVSDYVGTDGETLTLNIYNDIDAATIVYKGEAIDLQSQKPASGIWYKNDHYELSGKGQQIELKKDGQVVFTHKGETPIVNDYVGTNGETLTLNVYNDTEQATAVYKGETIDMVSQRPASGVWYKNDHYELRGKGDQIELKKDEQTIFKTK